MGDVVAFVLVFVAGMVAGITAASVVWCHVVRGERQSNTARLGGVLTSVGGFQAKRGVDPSLVIPPRCASGVVPLKVVRR